MTNLILGIIIGAVITAFTLSVADRTRERVVGACKHLFGQSRQKQKRKERIVGLLKERGELQNIDIRDALGVSAKTVVNYMDELEEAGEVEQVGETGRAVTYRLTR